MAGLLAKAELLYNGINNLTRIISGTVIIFVVFLIWYVCVSPLFESTASYNSKTKFLKREVDVYKEQVEKLKNIDTKNAVNVLMKERDDKKAVLVSIIKEIKQYQSASVSKKRLFIILKDLIDKTSSLELVNFENLPKRLLLKTTAGLFYKVPIQVTLKGDYNNIYAYIKGVEKQDISLYWDSLDYNVLTYPDAEVTIQFHLISASPVKKDKQQSEK